MPRLLLGSGLLIFAHLKVLPGQFHASLLMLVTGLLLVGIAEVTGSPNHIKIAVKILIALASLLPHSSVQRKYKAETNSTGLAHAVGGLAVVNVAVAPSGTKQLFTSAEYSCPCSR